MTTRRGPRPQWSSFRSIRDEALSQAEVADAIGITRQAIQQAERSGLAKLRPLCEAMGLHPGDIVALWPREPMQRTPGVMRWPARLHARTSKGARLCPTVILWDRQALGQVPDTTIARRLGCSVDRVRRARVALGIGAKS